MIDLSSLSAKWPSTLVSRDSISQLTGGLLSGATLANKEKEAGLKPIRFGRKVGYRVADVVAYLESIATEPGGTADELLLARMERARKSTRRGK